MAEDLGLPIASDGPIICTLDREAALERFVEALEQMDVLGLLARKVEQGADAVIVAAQRRASMIDEEREDEFLDDPEDAQILMRANLVEDLLLLNRQTVNPARRSPAPGSRA